jgi:hypothetical protein
VGEAGTMKHEAISSHEKPHIIHALAKTPSWQGKRKGVFVRIVRMPTPAGTAIGFFVDLPRFRSQPEHSARTVADAIDQINALILAGDRP